MNCVPECEYCKSINVLIDGENCSIGGYYCKKLKRLVQINKPVEKDCPFYFEGYTYKDLVDLRFKMKVILESGVVEFKKGCFIPVNIANYALKEFDKLLNRNNEESNN